MPLKVGVIGCGFQGRLHVDCLTKISDVEVIAIVDTNTDRLNELGNDFNINSRYHDYREFLEDCRCDLVTICTMPVFHSEMTIAALENGAHVLCEKPLAMNAQEGKEMVLAAKKAGKILAVGYNMRFTPNALLISDFIEKGKLGKPIKTRAWANASQIPWWGEHYRREISGGGALAATAVHFLDLALHFSGFPKPISVSASSTSLFPRKRGGTIPKGVSPNLYTSEDLISAHIRFDNGFWLDLEGSWIDNQPSVDGQPSWDYSLDSIGETGQVRFDPLSIRTEDNGEIIDVLSKDTLSDVSFPPSVAALILDVIQAVRDGRQPKVTGEEALAVQIIVDAIYESAKTFKEVRM